MIIASKTFKCQICNKYFLTIIGLGTHIGMTHINSCSLKEYYNKYIRKEGEGKCLVCGMNTSFITLGQGYLKYCSQSCAAGSNESQNKIRITCLNKYGVSHHSKSLEVKEKKIRTFQDHYGCDYNLQSVDVKRCIRKTNLRKYGVENPSQSYYIKSKFSESHKKSFFNTLLLSTRLKFKCTPNFTIDDYQGVDYKYSWTCTKCQTVFEDTLINGHIPRCLNCYPHLNGISHLEKEVVDFIKSLEIDFIENDRKILNGKELDIYIPSHNLAVEFNGIYWHSELGGHKDKDYHLNKTLECQKKGIQLIHIFEDEWIDKQEIIKSIITAKLGKITNRIFARKCQLKEVPNQEARLFLFDNHLQGPINGTHIGLYFENELVSLLSYGKSRFNKNYNYEILRFCNKLSTSTIGGLSKLLKHANLESVITYADLRYGTGDSYLKCGFKYKCQSPPSYYYLKDNQRISRLNFQKHLLEDKLDIFDINLTEWQNMQLNNYDRIWDCGTISYRWDNG